jgi:hypothetical protein
MNHLIYHKRLQIQLISEVKGFELFFMSKMIHKPPSPKLCQK